MQRSRALVVSLAIAASRCAAPALPAEQTGPVAGPTAARYALIDHFGGIGGEGAGRGVFTCDRDFYPVGSAEGEQQNALVQFHAIAADAEEFAQILARLGLPGGGDYSDAQKLAIYRQHKNLAAVTVSADGSGYRFELRHATTSAQGEVRGETVRGHITAAGAILVHDTDPAFLTCPICLAEGTRIATPLGEVAVERLRPGDLVWTLTRDGRRVVAPIERVLRVPADPGHELVRLALDDGRELLASPGHPTADGRVLAVLSAGDRLDAARIRSAARVRGATSATFDLLPAGETGFYWADGIQLGSTLALRSARYGSRLAGASAGTRVPAASSSASSVAANSFGPRPSSSARR